MNNNITCAYMITYYVIKYNRIDTFNYFPNIKLFIKKLENMNKLRN